MSSIAPALTTLAGRRFSLTARTPRELVVPLLTPIMFALVIAPALKTALHTSSAYESFVAVGTVGLLIPLNTMLSGLGVIVDRVSGAQRELLSAPVPRALLVLGNLVVALAITGLQVAVLIGVASARGIDFNASAQGVAWFLAGALFPITALPTFLEWVAKFLPLSHGLALMRYGLTSDASGLHNIWGMDDATAMAALSLAVIGVFAAGLTVASVRVFARSALR
jgi:ABC-type polysaccharide/polyol phosphate export permease